MNDQTYLLMYNVIGSKCNNTLDLAKMSHNFKCHGFGQSMNSKQIRVDVCMLDDRTLESFLKLFLLNSIFNLVNFSHLSLLSIFLRSATFQRNIEYLKGEKYS